MSDRKTHDKSVASSSLKNTTRSDANFAEHTAANPAHLRRTRLRVAIKVLLLFAALVAVYVLLASFLTTQPDEKDYETQRIDARAQLPGEMALFNWNGRPVLVLRRSVEQLEALRTDTPGLLDPNGLKSQQPAFAITPLRSRDPEWFIAIALGTDLSCGIEWQAADKNLFAGLSWPGGFADACSGYRYDLAGRVYSGQRAKRNLAVPDYLMEANGVFLLGGTEAAR